MVFGTHPMCCVLTSSKFSRLQLGSWLLQDLCSPSTWMICTSFSCSIKGISTGGRGTALWKASRKLLHSLPLFLFLASGQLNISSWLACLLAIAWTKFTSSLQKHGWLKFFEPLQNMPVLSARCGRKAHLSTVRSLLEPRYWKQTNFFCCGSFCHLFALGNTSEMLPNVPPDTHVDDICSDDDHGPNICYTCALSVLPCTPACFPQPQLRLHSSPLSPY